MEISCSNFLHAKILSVLTAFYFFSLQHLSTTVSLSAHTPTGNIFLHSGSNGTFNTQDGRNWIGDIDTPYFPSEPPNEASLNYSVPEEVLSNMVEKVPYMTVRLSSFPFTYTAFVSAGQKFIRFHFHTTTYANFDSSKAFFSVNVGPLTLLSNFSASLTAADYGQDTFYKEFCITVEEDQRLNITFTPSPDYQDAYAFINGIEIVSVPDNLYYAPGAYISKFVGHVNPYSFENRSTLEMLHRINVGGSLLPAINDTGMYRIWMSDFNYFTDTKSSVIPVNSGIHLKFIVIPNYTAPVAFYETARSMGPYREINENSSLTWQFPVDSGFIYVVRLHFCEFQTEISKVGDRVFQIHIANETAESGADVILWSGGNGVPMYRDFAVLVGRKENEKKQNLSIALRTAPEWRTVYSDAILNGLEILKVQSQNIQNLAIARPNPKSNGETVASPLLRKHKRNLATTTLIVGGVVSTFVGLCLIFLFTYRRRSKVKESVFGTGFSLCSFSSPKTKSTKFHGSSQPSDLCSHFSLSEIKAATNNFDDVSVIGVGGFGNVYKGCFIDNETTPVAIKRLNPGSQQGALEFKTEIEMLSQVRHRHLVSLIGYCDDDSEMILVYDYMARGTLRDHLYNSDNPPLPWNQRLQICIGAARGLHYLHTGAKHIIIHRDVKTTNILLDEQWVAKVSDFGLSTRGPTSISQTHISTTVKGTFGYLDPNYFLLQQLTEKSDVYSFGVVLFEVLCARPPVLRIEDWKRASLAVWARECHNNGTFDQIVDPFLQGKIEPECLIQFVDVAISCLDEDRNKRPSMSEVVYGLEFALRLQISKEFGEAYINSSHLDEGNISVESYATDDSGTCSVASIGERVVE